MSACVMGCPQPSLDPMTGWISTHDALQSLTVAMEPPKAVRILCEWAKEGFVAARAKRLVIAGEARENVSIPPDFWWEVPEIEANELGWQVGQFRSIIGQEYDANGRMFCRAYGVEFSRDELEKMGVYPLSIRS